jgi:hypothetical protein
MYDLKLEPQGEKRFDISITIRRNKWWFGNDPEDRNGQPLGRRQQLD